MKKVKDIIEKLIDRRFVVLTKRGNRAIDIGLKIAKDKLSKKKVIIPYEGGWIHYKKAPEKVRMQIVYVNTKDGLIDKEDLRKKVCKDSVLLCNSMPGYFVVDYVEEIYNICKDKDCLMINDVAGSIGQDEAKIGDIIIGSFGRWKPVNLEYGGFIASDNIEHLRDFCEEEFDIAKIDELIKKLENLDKRLARFYEVRKKVIKNLSRFDILYKDKKGINVIVSFKNNDENKEILDYCKNEKLEYTVCPRYIRVMRDAICIEIKRLS